VVQLRELLREREYNNVVEKSNEARQLTVCVVEERQGTSTTRAENDGCIRVLRY
jgi:hypothetical protein